MTLTLTPVTANALTVGQALDVTSIALTSSHALSAGVTIPSGTTVFQVNSYGDLLAGTNTNLVGTGASFNSGVSVADFAYMAAARKVLCRSMLIREVGDSADLQIGRAGDSGYPDGPIVGTKTNQTIGNIYWVSAITPYGGTAGSTGFLAFADISYSSAAILCTAQENAMELTSHGSGSYAVGGELRFQTAPTGGGGQVDRISIRANGQVGIFGATMSRGDLDSYSRGDLIVEGIVYGASKVAAAKTSIGAVGPSSEGGLKIGSSTNLYRYADSVLKSDGKIVAASGLGVGNSAAATTLGTVTKKIQVFDATGASIGYVPVYDAIT